MAPPSGRTRPGLSPNPSPGQLLFAKPTRFDFFQAVRLLERLLRAGDGDGAAPGKPVGHDHPPEQEVVRFRALAALSFPASPVAHLHQPAPPRGAGPEAAPPPPEMDVTFLGLTGPNGVLPHHYTALLLQRLKDKDASLRDFLDLFHHRLVSLFFRAWEKYRLPFAYERARLDGDQPDPVTQGLYCLVGFGTGGIRGRQGFDDEALLHYAGHFAHAPRSASALEAVLGDHFGAPVRVLQLQGQWLYLEPDDHATLPGPARPKGRNNAVGLNLVIGDRVWDVQSKFRLRVGPLKYEQFRALMPNGGALRPLGQMTRTFVGPGLDFDVQPVLAPGEVPWCRLPPADADADAGAGGDGPFLGWNTWVRTGPFVHAVDDPTFTPEND